MPKTKLGKWSARLMLVFFILFGVFQIAVASGQEGGDTFLDNPLLSITGSLMFLASVLAGVFGLIAIVKQKERSVLAYIITVLGLLIFVFLVGELVSPE